MHWLGLEDKVVVVTGGAAGIGLAVVEEFLAIGARVAVCDVRAEAPEYRGATAQNLLYVPTDVTQKSEVDALFSRVLEHFGTVDVLVNNAGITVPRLLVDEGGEYELDEATWDRVMNVNVKGLFFCSQAAARVMKAKRAGVIVNMSSECGLEGSEGQSVYAASKGAINALTRSWAKEQGKNNVRVLACAPGIMEATGLRTDAYNEALAYTRGCKPEDLSTDYSKVIPLGRDGKLDEVGDLVAYLVSDRASYIAGTTINISGGKSRG